MTDKEKAFFLHLALGAFESVRADEPEKSSRNIRLGKSMDRILELIDVYRLEAWPKELAELAGNIVDEFNERIARAFGEEAILQKQPGDTL
jgi:hypothetical protein